MPDVSLENKKFKVPDKLVLQMKKNISGFGGPKTTEGYERCTNIIEEPIISLALLKKIVNFFKTADEEDSPYHLTGGELGKKIFTDMLRSSRDSEKTGRKVKMRGGLSNTHKKEHTKDGNANPTKVSLPRVDKNLREQIDRIKSILKYL